MLNAFMSDKLLENVLGIPGKKDVFQVLQYFPHHRYPQSHMASPVARVEQILTAK